MNRFEITLNPYTFDINADKMVHEAPVILFYTNDEIVASVPETSIIIKKN